MYFYCWVKGIIPVGNFQQSSFTHDIFRHFDLHFCCWKGLEPLTMLLITIESELIEFRLNIIIYFIINQKNKFRVFIRHFFFTLFFVHLDFFYMRCLIYRLRQTTSLLKYPVSSLAFLPNPIMSLIWIVSTVLWLFNSFNLVSIMFFYFWNGF